MPFGTFVTSELILLCYAVASFMFRLFASNQLCPSTFRTRRACITQLGWSPPVWFINRHSYPPALQPSNPPTPDKQRRRLQPLFFVKLFSFVKDFRTLCWYRVVSCFLFWIWAHLVVPRPCGRHGATFLLAVVVSLEMGSPIFGFSLYSLVVAEHVRVATSPCSHSSCL